MKKLVTTLAALAVCAALAPMASATVLVSESFTYANGNLVPNGGWANYSGAATDIQVVSGRATGGAFPNNQNDDHKLFTAQTLTAKTYACFEVTIPAFVGQPKPIYFFSLKDGGTANLVSRVYVLPLAAGGWTFGLSHSSTSATVGVTPWTATLSPDVSYRVTINYDPATKTSNLWVNANLESDPSIANSNAVIAAVAVSGVGLRQSNTASTLPAAPAYTGTADWNFSVDNLGVGNTFDEACFQYSPTRKSTWGQVKTLYR